METYSIPEIAKDVFCVGAKDWNRRMFDALIPLPQGTSYNAYLVKGQEKVALIDTVNPGFEEEFENKINMVSSLEKLDYLIMNHAEPDHANAIRYIMDRAPASVLITTERGVKMASLYHELPEGRVKVVAEGDTLDLGGKTLRFIEAPWLHWPETMFTYLPEDRVLFPCDFFGAHTAQGIYDEDLEDLIPLAKRYYGEIMMPFGKMGAKALEKIKDLDIEIIAPSHGPIYKNPQRILEPYAKWTAGETENKALIVYVSMWGSTQLMVKTIAEVLMKEGIDVRIYDLAVSDTGDIARELVDSRAIILGAPTVLAGMHPLAVYGTYLVKALNPPAKYGVILGSFGWGGGALKQAGDILVPSKMEVVGTLQVKGKPREEDLKKIEDIGRELAQKMKTT
ncbi:Flavorubredoxin [Methanosarcina thermophila]|jgi:flavorubredoxin|uniref:Flavodoxin n=3 Tax=Methanosarcina thermophila TaxID=2210 RepID=A0A1I7AJF6_METTE|nr:FprA family A-type flavoprotein [Methanosarcina thermophila]ALK05986.1 MAG: metallo-beta-lactamase [Methanosarcina sp. 795]AKB12439.1 Flavodoxin [Methanosarcina thermophila TM-1]AKB14357.1 Flavodoxin [Methanosarcina thermophila CHTI-55]NLU57908.1 FprA family A-type flavoprotein [Methanosarcina thermophila]SFT75072.1 Flavorubredoxin [Methanosarcina thermophila]